MRFRTLLITPPMTQLNTPYPATAYLTGFLRSRGHDCVQADLAIELINKLFSKQGILDIYKEVSRKKKRVASTQFFYENYLSYFSTIEPIIRFLQGKDPSLATRIASRQFLPEGPRFAHVLPEEFIEHAFGSMGVQDYAKYLASIYIDDLSDVLTQGINAEFSLARYGEKLAASAPTFKRMEAALRAKPTLIDRYLDELTQNILKRHTPDLVGLTAPFPGNVYGALRIAQSIRRHAPHVKIAFGGGYANTELREISDPGIFDYVDFITLDDGERPLLCLIEHLQEKRPLTHLLRTFIRENNKVQLISHPQEHDIPFRDSGTPTYDGLPLDNYISVLEMPNPMHRIWSDARWNKMTIAHGCYWKKCSFCDVNLDYIGRYDPAPADLLLHRMESLIRETGQTGFHFVDEAAPPAALHALSKRILEKGLSVSWWGNVRFEKAFTPELCNLMAQAGCIAVTGGLEVASDRLLKLMQKGVSIAQVAQVTRAFRDAGILVHAYLMYGFPTQTLQETVDSLEVVRQLFAEGLLQSAYWHRFSATVHSPIGKNPEKYGIKIKPAPKTTFAKNDWDFEDPTGCNHDAVGPALKKALYNYMHGIGLDEDVRVWFEEVKVLKTTVPKDLIQSCLRQQSFIANSLRF